jgi:hypothetical protein
MMSARPSAISFRTAQGRGDDTVPGVPEGEEGDGCLKLAGHLAAVGAAQPTGPRKSKSGIRIALRFKQQMARSHAARLVPGVASSLVQPERGGVADRRAPAELERRSDDETRGCVPGSARIAGYGEALALCVRRAFSSGEVDRQGNAGDLVAAVTFSSTSTKALRFAHRRELGKVSELRGRLEHDLVGPGGSFGGTARHAGLGYRRRATGAVEYDGNEEPMHAGPVSAHETLTSKSNVRGASTLTWR